MVVFNQFLCTTYIYPLKDYDSCGNTECIKHNIIPIGKNNEKSIRTSTLLDKDNLYSTLPIKYQWEELHKTTYTLDEKLKNCVITTSMANEKTGSAPLGGYIKLTVEKINP